MRYARFLGPEAKSLSDTCPPFRRSEPSGEFARLFVSLREPDVRPPGKSTLPGLYLSVLECIATKHEANLTGKSLPGMLCIANSHCGV